MIAQTVRSARGEARSIRDPMNRAWQRTLGGIYRGMGNTVNYFGGGTSGSWFGNMAERQGYGRLPEDLQERTSSLQNELTQLAEQRMTAEMRHEDEIIRKRRQLLKEELDVIQQRMMAAEGRFNQAESRRIAARHAFGRMSEEDRMKTQKIAKKVAGGATREDFSLEDLHFIDRNRAIFDETARRFENDAADEGGFREFEFMGRDFDFGARANREAGLMNEMAQQMREIQADAIFDVELNIERLQLEASRLADEMAEALRPQIEDLYQQVVRETKEQIKLLREDAKLGGRN